jgi:cysteine desulfuration protein SufE
MSVESIKEKQNEIIDEFSMLDDWTDKYQYIIDAGQELPKLDDEYKTEENKVKGCQSQVWLHTDLDGGKVVYEADSDAMITKGLISMLVRVLSNEDPESILNTELYFIDNVGMREHLSPTRSNGLSAMVKQMKTYALAYKAKAEN